MTGRREARKDEHDRRINCRDSGFVQLSMNLTFVPVTSLDIATLAPGQPAGYALVNWREDICMGKRAIALVPTGARRNALR